MSRGYYTKGSEALNSPVIVGFPKERVERRKQRRPERRRHEQRYAGIGFAPSVNFAIFFFLFLLVAGLLYSCLKYLSVIDNMSQLNRKVGQVTAEAARLKGENDNKEMKIYAGVDFEKIRDKALNELGMVYPYKNHVITYNATSSGYVRQYGELNGNKDLNVLERFLSMFAAR